MNLAPPIAHSRPLRLAFWTVGGLASVWAAAWCAFAIIAGTTGEDWRGYLIAAGFVGGTCAPVLAAWRFPRIGGLALAVLGLWGWGFFHSQAATIGLSVPAILLGLSFVLLGAVGAWQRSRHRRITVRA